MIQIEKSIGSKKAEKQIKIYNFTKLLNNESCLTISFGSFQLAENMNISIYNFL